MVGEGQGFTDGTGMKAADTQMKQRTYAEAASQVEVKAPVALSKGNHRRDGQHRWAT